MRLLFASVFMFGALLSIARPADAEPCAIEVRSAYFDAQAHEFVVTFSSLVQGTADLRVTLYAGASTYAFHLPDVRFEQKDASPEATSRPWRSAPTFVRAATDAEAPTVAVLALLDPTTKMPIACDGDRERLTPTVGASYESTEAQRHHVPLERANAPVGTAAAPIAATISSAGVPACEKPSAPASVDRIAQASYPPLARARGETGKVLVLVELASTGTVVAATISRSSGYDDLDASARDAAVASTFHPERFRCDPVSGSYLFSVYFTGSR